MSINTILKPPTSTFFQPSNPIISKEESYKENHDNSSTTLLSQDFKIVKVFSSGIIHPVSGVSSYYSNHYSEELLDSIEDYEFNNLISQVNLSSQSYWPCHTCYYLSYLLSLLTCGCCCSSFCQGGSFLQLSESREHEISISSLFLCFSRPSPATSYSSISMSPSSASPFTSSCIFINKFMNDNVLNNFLFSSLSGSSSAIEVKKNIHNFQLKSSISQKNIHLNLVPASLFYRLNLHSFYKPIEVPNITTQSYTIFSSFFLPSYIEFIIPIDNDNMEDDIESSSSSSSSSPSTSTTTTSPVVPESVLLKPRQRKKESSIISY